MNAIIGIGIACVLGAIAGGGFEALGAKIPVIPGVARQLLLAAFGIMIIGLGVWLEKRDDGSRAREAAPSGISVSGPVSNPEVGMKLKVDQSTTDISGLWHDVNHADWLVEQVGTVFTYHDVSSSGSGAQGEGNIINGKIILTHHVGTIKYKCELELATDRQSILGTCHSEKGGDSKVLWSR